MVYVMRKQDHEMGPSSQVDSIHGGPDLRDHHCQNMSREVSLRSRARAQKHTHIYPLKLRWDLDN
jgi:hypothetical protein